MRWILGLGLLASGVGCWAQGIGVRVGFFKGSSFSGSLPGSSISLEGFEGGLDFMVFKLPVGLAEIRLSPTFCLGGSNRKGPDSDGTQFRILANAKFSVPGAPFYGVAGIGYGTTRPRGSSRFDSQNGVYTQLGVGFELGPKLPLVPQPFLELGYLFGQRSLSGLSIDVGVKF